MQSSVGNSDVAVLVMVAGTSTVFDHGWVHEHASPNERLRFEWVQGCSCHLRVYTQNESGWKRREQERCRVIRVGKVQMSVGVAQERCARHVEFAGVIGAASSTAVVEHPEHVHDWECSCFGFVLHGMMVHRAVHDD